MGAPVALLPERVELLVAHQVVALGRRAALRRVDRSWAQRRWRTSPRCRCGAPATARWTHLPLQLRPVDAGGPVDPAAEQGDRIERRPRPASARSSSRRSAAARRRPDARQVSTERRTVASAPAAAPLSAAERQRTLAIVDLDQPAASPLAEQLVGDREAMPGRPLGLDRVGERAVDQVRVDENAELRQLARARRRSPVARSASALRRRPRSRSLRRSTSPSGFAPAARRASPRCVGLDREVRFAGRRRRPRPAPARRCREPAISQAPRPSTSSRQRRPGGKRRRGGGQRMDDQPRRQLRILLRHPPQRRIHRPGRLSLRRHVVPPSILAGWPILPRIPVAANPRSAGVASSSGYARESRHFARC